MFEKATKTVKNVSENMVQSAKTVGTTIYSSTKEQSELAGLNVQKSVLERKLESSYAEIGKRYVEYVKSCNAEVQFDVTDIIESIEPELERLDTLTESIEKKQEEIKQASDDRLRKRAEKSFEEEKGKLDKALELDIINEGEYKEKLEKARKKLDNYEILRKVDLQYEMGIISAEEYEMKRKNILG